METARQLPGTCCCCYSVLLNPKTLIISVVRQCQPTSKNLPVPTAAHSYDSCGSFLRNNRNIAPALYSSSVRKHSSSSIEHHLLLCYVCVVIPPIFWTPVYTPLGTRYVGASVRVTQIEEGHTRESLFSSTLLLQFVVLALFVSREDKAVNHFLVDFRDACDSSFFCWVFITK